MEQIRSQHGSLAAAFTSGFCSLISKIVQPGEQFDDLALSVQEARFCFKPPVSDQTIYRMIWNKKLKVLDQPGVIRIPLSELKKHFGKVTVYKPRRRKAVATTP